MIEFEVQQQFLRDIEWMQQQKVRVLEREERRAHFEIEKQKMKEQRDRFLAERKKRDEEYKAKQAER